MRFALGNRCATLGCWTRCQYRVVVPQRLPPMIRKSGSPRHLSVAVPKLRTDPSRAVLAQRGASRLAVPIAPVRLAMAWSAHCSGEDRLGERGLGSEKWPVLYSAGTNGRARPERGPAPTFFCDC